MLRGNVLNERCAENRVKSSVPVFRATVVQRRNPRLGAAFVVQIESRYNDEKCFQAQCNSAASPHNSGTIMC